MQLSLFYDYQAILDSCPFYQKYDALFQAFDMIYSGPDYPEFGRKGYPRSAYLKALIYKQCEHIKFNSDLIRDLESRPVLCEMCGFSIGKLPGESQFSRFPKRIKNSEIEAMLHASGKILFENDVISLDVLIADSKPVKANTKHNNPKNPNRSFNKKDKIKRNPAATLSFYSYIKQPTSGKDKDFSWFWGYRTHVLISKQGVPLVEVTRPNNVTDAKIAKALLNKLIRVYGQEKGRIFIADSAYDERDIYNFVAGQLKGEAFIPLNERNKQPDKLFGPHNLPLCQATLEMKFTGIAREPHRTRKKFRCPIIAGSKKEKALLPTQCPVEHERFHCGKRFGCTSYIDITDDARSRVPRESKRYKDTYKMRTEAERYFSRFGPREVEETSCYNYRAIRNQMSIAHLSLSLTALAAAVILERPENIRRYKTFARTA